MSAATALTIYLLGINIPLHSSERPLPSTTLSVWEITHTVRSILNNSCNIPLVISNIALQYLEYQPEYNSNEDEGDRDKGGWTLVKDRTRWTLAYTWQQSNKAITSIIYSSQGKILSVADNKIWTYNPKDLTLKSNLQLNKFTSTMNTQYSLIEGSDRNIYLIQSRIDLHEEQPSGSYLTIFKIQKAASLIEEDTLKTWQCFEAPYNPKEFSETTYALKYTLSQQKGKIAYICDWKYKAYGRRERVTVVDIATKEKHVFTPTLKAYNVALSPDGKLLAIGIVGYPTEAMKKQLEARTTQFCSPTTGNRVQAIEIYNIATKEQDIIFDQSIDHLALSNKGTFSSASKRAWCISWPGNKYQHRYRFYPTALSYYNDGDAIIGIGCTNEKDVDDRNKRIIEIRNSESGDIIPSSKYLKKYGVGACTLCFSSNNEYLAVGYDNGTINTFMRYPPSYDITSPESGS